MEPEIVADEADSSSRVGVSPMTVKNLINDDALDNIAFCNANKINSLVQCQVLMQDPKEDYDEDDREQILADVKDLRKLLEAIGKPVRFENEAEIQAAAEASTIEETNRMSASDAKQVDQIKMKIAETVYSAMLKRNKRVAATCKAYAEKNQQAAMSGSQK